MNEFLTNFAFCFNVVNTVDDNLFFVNFVMFIYFPRKGFDNLPQLRDYIKKKKELFV